MIGSFLGNRRDKKLYASLCSLYGVGETKAIEICHSLGFSPNTPMERLSTRQQDQLRSRITADDSLGEPARRLLRQHVAQLLKIPRRRSWRMREGLPTRGQRTQTNASTAKKLNSKRGYF